MKQGSKYIRVLLKLYVRSLKRSPHTVALTAMAIITFSLSGYISYDAFVNHGRFAQSTFTKWNSYQHKLSGRSVAGYQTSQCDNKNINYTNLMQEIRLLESQYETGHFIEGNWFGVKLGELPSIQAQFLADNGKYLGNKNENQNFAHCKNVACIIATFYNGDTEAGLLAYYWYLKTGSTIAMTNKLPEQESNSPGEYNNRKHLFKDYLFSKDELVNFFVLAKSLPERFLHNPLLKSIHKLPNNSKIEKFSAKECAMSSAHGHILVNQECLGHNANIEKFLLTISSQMARYIDISEGKTKDSPSITSSADWLDRSLWIKDEFFNLYSKEYNSKWYSHMPGKQFVSADAKISPSNQLVDLISYYRFKPALFSNNTPNDIAIYIKDEIFNGQRFDGNGLYKQYITSAVNFWSKKEVGLWADCFEQHLHPDSIENSARDLASQVDNPLYSCVERKIPSFITEAVNTIKNQNYEGCKFFNDKQKYGHLSEQFHTVLDKFLQERILKRKIEFQNHGLEVLVGQTIKHEFIKSVDPSSVFVNCYNEDSHKECYEEKMLHEVGKLLNKNHHSLSDYYKKIIKDDVLQLYPFNDIKKNTNEIAKKFITPFYNKIKLTAEYLWSSCKEESFSISDKVNLPMKFSGGKHFVNAKLLNCVNEKMEEELYEVADFGAFHQKGDEVVEFKLNSKEKEFALSFMEGKLVQILNNILDEQVKHEKIKLDQHFKATEGDIAKALMNDEQFFANVYSFTQVSDECLERVNQFYPEKFFYQSKASVDKNYGRKICSTVINTPQVKQNLTAKVNKKWEDNKKLAKSFLDAYFEEYVEECYDDFPAEPGRMGMKNKRMRKICIEESFEYAVNDAMIEWQEDEQYDYFKHKEKELANSLFGHSNQMTRAASSNN